ncbi:MFS transporter [Pseudoduganella namucuonensis]|uniref:MFS transporter, YNFM family, putative membrane transport protein n=1 Tax=Pseudoduganella namucuonensis TaxID=1035707 RepID=A0A1I7I8G8_9BURK|nr:MFS transporter [Pseudoduganella namucuonensis]SFU69262.1 MFS transporter, YNFM family, putative membrane transport protein [Pseudoduganella namucuonensis]
MAIAAGTPAFKRSNRALFFGGFSSFALLYSVQPLMPLLAGQFALTPAQSSLALSVSTAALAVSLLLASALSDRVGRKPLMVAALAIAAALTLACAAAQNYGQLLLMRAALGFALGGMPAIAMAYLAEEIEPASLGWSMGLYISGSAFGGMAGRVLTSVLSDFWSWRVAMAALGAAGLLAAWEFWRSLPRSRNFRPVAGGWRALPDGLRLHLSDDGLPWLFALGFLFMGCMVSAYNYIGYRLLDAPFGLRQSTVGAISFLYLLGIFSSVWAGRLADRLGRRGVLWIMIFAMLGGLLLTLSDALPLILAGMALFTFGFFASHSIASSWVGRRAQAPQALASALYLFFYYLGSSVVGWLCGLLWAGAGWPGVVALLGGCLGCALLIALRLRHLAPLPSAMPMVVPRAAN